MTQDNKDKVKTPDGLPVPGYKPQNDKAIALVTKNKQIEEGVLRVLDLLRTDPDIDPRWLAIGRTHIEEGFMAINRSVFKPERAALPDEEKIATAQVTRRATWWAWNAATSRHEDEDNVQVTRDGYYLETGGTVPGGV